MPRELGREPLNKLFSRNLQKQSIYANLKEKTVRPINLEQLKNIFVGSQKNKNKYNEEYSDSSSRFFISPIHSGNGPVKLLPMKILHIYINIDSLLIHKDPKL